MEIIDRAEEIIMLAKIKMSNSDEVMNLFEEYDGNFTNNRYVMLSAVNTNDFVLQYASPRVQEDKDIIHMIVSEIITGRATLNPSSIDDIIKPIISSLDTEKLAKNNSSLEVISIALKTVRNELEKEENIIDEKTKVLGRDFLHNKK